MNKESRQVFEFEDFRVVPEEGLLLKNGVPVSLTPKAFSVLLILLEKNGRLVEKGELVEKVWENAFVEEAAVSRCIWTIRTALGEDSKEQRFIQTVPKRGYRFVAPLAMPVEDVRLISEPVLEPEPLDKAGVAEIRPEKPLHIPASHLRKGIPRIALVGAVILVLFGVAFAGYYFYGPGSNSHPTKLAILPLKPVNERTREIVMEFAIAEALILKMSEAQSFDVKRLNTVRKFIDLDRDPIEAGRELGVEYVLSSNYLIDNGYIRVTSQLLNIRSGSVERTFKSETKADNIFWVQDAVANEIGNAIFDSFNKPAGTYLADRGTKDPEAYGLYHQALYLNDKMDRDSSARAVELLNKALERDPAFAQAWAIKAHAICQFAHLGGGPPTVLLKSALPPLERAMQLNPNIAVAHAVRGTLNRDYFWNFAEARKDLERALALDPDCLLAYRVLGGLAYRERKYEEAVAIEKRAIELSPTSLADRLFLGEYSAMTGDYDEAVAQLQKVAEMESSWPVSYSSLWVVHYGHGDEAKAYEAFMKFKRLRTDDQALIQKYEDSYASAGFKGLLRTELDHRLATDIKGEFSRSKYFIAQLALMLGEKDIAFRYLEESLSFRSVDFSTIKADPHMDSIRSDPRYEDLLRRAKL